jgi:hypothetical protein
MNNFKIIGVGSSGYNIIRYICEMKLKEAGLIVVDNSRTINEDPHYEGISFIEPLALDFEDEKIYIDYVDPRKEYNKMIRKEIAEAINGVEIVFIVTGMGGNAGTLTSPEIARVARNMGIVTISITTMPFIFEGIRRKEHAKKGIDNLEHLSDAFFVINLDDLLDAGINDSEIKIYNRLNLFNTPINVTIPLERSSRFSIKDAFKWADDAIFTCIQCFVSRYRNVTFKRIIGVSKSYLKPVIEMDNE